MTAMQTTEITPPPQASSKPLAKGFVYQSLAPIGNSMGLKALAEIMRDKIAEALPRHVTPDRMVKALLTAAMKQPKIFLCTQESIIKALIDASTLGLDCSGTLGSGYLVPFNKSVRENGNWSKRMEVQFIPGYRGLIDLARRSGEIASIEAHMVYAQDKFLLRYGTEKKLDHEPYLKADRREEYIAVYAVATLKDGTQQIEVMTLADVHKIMGETMRKNGQKEVSGPWKDHFSEMARKTVIRRLMKYLPLSPELERVMEHDDNLSSADERIVDVTQIATKDRTSDLERRIGLDEYPAPSAGEVIDPDTGEVLGGPEAEEAPPQEAPNPAKE